MFLLGENSNHRKKIIINQNKHDGGDSKTGTDF
jgi:hypothetical protein